MVASNIFFIFTPICGEMIQFEEHIFSTGLVQPPTRTYSEIILKDTQWMGIVLQLYYDTFISFTSSVMHFDNDLRFM